MDKLKMLLAAFFASLGLLFSVSAPALGGAAMSVYRTGCLTAPGQYTTGLRVHKQGAVASQCIPAGSMGLDVSTVMNKGAALAWAEATFGENAEAWLQVARDEHRKPGPDGILGTVDDIRVPATFDW